jgi:hypothetical protein
LAIRRAGRQQSMGATGWIVSGIAITIVFVLALRYFGWHR